MARMNLAVSMYSVIVRSRALALGIPARMPSLMKVREKRGQRFDGGQLIISELRKDGFELVGEGNPGVDDELLGLQERHEQQIEITPEVARELELLAVQVES